MDAATKQRFLGELFPTRLSAVVFVAYIGFFVNQGILVTATKNSQDRYDYNVTAVVMLTELCKLFAATLLYLRDHSFQSLLLEISKNRKVLFLYFVPALLYCFYNNLAFVNLAAFDPTTYNLLLQFRVVITGLSFQVLFKKQLTRKQWLSLLLLTAGCIVKHLGLPAKPLPAAGGKVVGLFSSLFSAHMLLLLVQVFCSCFAGVYNEFLLKDTGVNIDIMIHNVFMYIDSIVCNAAVLLVRGEAASALSRASVATLINPLVIAIIVNGAICGIVTSVFLKSLNSILKTFASALDLSVMAVLCWIIFKIPVDTYTVAAIAIVSVAIYCYSQQPVVNKPKETPHCHDDDDLERSLVNGSQRSAVVTAEKGAVMNV
ncbi:UDP-galactose transporter senju [Dermacentor andersoni]|uniref:UDP-galactose transporter senju n=1 Tax=Dermacentor andersoni TaxID=34620 RepID=UPI0021555FEE|nr:UDP-galactose transporter senju-like [Dermacentor andersoni]